MADDIDRITEREARHAGKCGEITHPKWEIDAYAAHAPEPTEVEVLSSFAPQWLTIEGWVKTGESAGKVRLAWRGEGPPVRPRRPRTRTKGRAA